MTHPLVSILVRSIDRNTLTETLASVAKQNYPAIEVLVVAAVPNHSPLSMVEPLPDVRLVTTDVALQRSVAANKALGLAQGVYALFLDDDDWIAPDHISSLVDALQQAPGIDVAYSQTRLVKDGEVNEDSAVLGMPFDALRLLAGNWMPLHSVLFSLRLRDLGCHFEEQLTLYEDWDFWLQAAQHSDFLFVPVVSAFYRIHDSSGVHAQIRFHGQSSSLVYNKWRHLWSDAQLSGMMSRVWEHDFLSTELAASKDQDLLLRKDWALMDATLKASKAQLVETNVKLVEANAKLVEIQAQQLALTQAHANELSDIFNSRSWRITEPLRQIAHFLRRVQGQAKSWARFALKALWALPKAPRLLREKGWRGVVQRLENELPQPEGFAYQHWIQAHEPDQSLFPHLAAKVPGWHYQPLVSVLMPTYNSPLPFLIEAVESVRAQIYPHWELCIADDASTQQDVLDYLQGLAAQDSRVVLTLRDKNGHISACSNTALESAHGEWVALLDHDDRLHPLALFGVVEALQFKSDANVVYSDEDKIDTQGVRFDPYFKGAFNRELMWAQNMVCHLGCYRRELVNEIGGFTLGLEGAQDHDLALRMIEKSGTDQVVYVPRVLYHWRAIPGSTAQSQEAKPYAESASKRAVQAHLLRMGIGAKVESAPEIPNMNRVRLDLPLPLPLVSLLIPTRDRIGLLRTCIDSVLNKSTYPQIEIIVIDNGSVEPDSLSYLASLSEQGVRVIRDDGPFNFSALNNKAAEEAKGEFICLMNNDIEIISPDWLEEMLSFAALPGVGAVGARLWYPENQGLQHGGVIIGIGGVAGHAHLRLAKGEVGYFGRAALHHRLQAVTAACLLIRKSHFWAVGGLDTQLAVAFNDVDFCLRLHQAGLACIYTPFAEMVHHESASRGDDLTGARRERFMTETRFMVDRWGDSLQQDPFFSPNLSLDHSDFRPAQVSRVPGWLSTTSGAP
jgi:glycosyltransferase involved in cell wall biosynthesis